MLPSPRTSQDDLVRDILVSSSSRLQVLWEEATVEERASPEVSLQRRSWNSAAQSLIHAMEALEGFAATMDPTLGRRDWRARTDGAGAGL